MSTHRAHSGSESHLQRGPISIEPSGHAGDSSLHASHTSNLVAHGRPGGGGWVLGEVVRTAGARRRSVEGRTATGPGPAGGSPSTERRAQGSTRPRTPRARPARPEIVAFGRAPGD